MKTREEKIEALLDNWMYNGQVDSQSIKNLVLYGYTGLVNMDDDELDAHYLGCLGRADDVDDWDDPTDYYEDGPRADYIYDPLGKGM